MEPKMEFNLQQIGAFLIETGMMYKPFAELNESQIIELCEAVHHATQIPVGECAPPYINGRGELIIPLPCDPRHQYWTAKGQTIKATLEEMGFTEADEIHNRYCPKQDREGMLKNQ